MNVELQATYDRIAQDWSADHGNDDWWVEGTDYFLSLLPNAGTVLDVGCGAGTKSKYIHERGHRVVGIDFSQGQLTLARDAVPNVEFRAIAMEDMDSIAETFDGLFAQAALLHIPKAYAANMVAKMADRLASRGYLYLAVKEIKQGGAEEELKKEQNYGYEYERFFSYFMMSELESYMRYAGLEVIWSNRKPSGRTIWLQIIGRK